MSAQKRELLKWLRGRYREAEARLRSDLDCREYGEAQLDEGMIQAYEYVIIHVKKEMT